jgi:TetR/AcrR family transcriptional repressor of nem operon
VQTRGFNGFSYADVAAQIGVTTASLHYHFPSKDHLGEALIERWTDRHLRALAAIETKHASGPARLDAYAQLYASMIRGSRLGLCGMLAAEHQTLSASMRELVAIFLTANQDWLESIMSAGHTDGTLVIDGSAREAALVFLAGVQGAALVARPHRDVDCFRTIVHWLLAAVAPTNTRR